MAFLQVSYSLAYGIVPSACGIRGCLGAERAQRGYGEFISHDWPGVQAELGRAEGGGGRMSNQTGPDDQKGWSGGTPAMMGTSEGKEEAEQAKGAAEFQGRLLGRGGQFV